MRADFVLMFSFEAFIIWNAAAHWVDRRHASEGPLDISLLLQRFNDGLDTYPCFPARGNRRAALHPRHVAAQVDSLGLVKEVEIAESSHADVDCGRLLRIKG